MNSGYAFSYLFSAIYKNIWNCPVFYPVNVHGQESNLFMRLFHLFLAVKEHKNNGR